MDLILIIARINDYINYMIWDEIIYPFPNFNGATVEVWECISNIIPHLTGCMITYPYWDYRLIPGPIQYFVNKIIKFSQHLEAVKMVSDRCETWTAKVSEL